MLQRIMSTKRKLDFQNKALNGQTFYVDIKAETLRRKVTRRIKELGGCIEGFLSKDIDLVLTDKNNGEIKRPKDPKSVQTTNLSRGKALLLKANTQIDSSKRSSLGGNDVIQSAVILGIKVTQAQAFLRESNKIVQNVKKSKTDNIEGIAPLEWHEAEKENRCCLKVEDTEQQYKPLIKYFDTFPSLYYHDEIASPFVKGVVLTKQTEKNVNRYSTAKKVVPNNNGGFCEACDYWYRCSLREHIKSAKHEKFVKDQTNFNNLDSVINKLPSLSNFFQKLGKDFHDNTDERSEAQDIGNDMLRKPDVLLDSEIKPLVNQLTNGSNNALDNKYKEMPCLSQEPCRSYLDQEQNTEIIYDTTSSYVKSSELQNNQMPVLEPEISINNDTRDSGTSPEVYDVNSNTEAISVTEKDMGIKRVDSDSALPPDEDAPMCFSPDTHSDNAVFIDDISNSSGFLGGNITSNVRKRFSKISLTEDSGTSESFSSVQSKKNADIVREENQKEGKMFCFSEISSPSTKSNGQFDFRNLASTWMMDIKPSENCVSSIAESSNTKELDFSGQHFSSVQHFSSTSMTKESCYSAQSLSQSSSMFQDESSRDSVSLISLPATPDCKYTSISEDSNSCFTPDNTLCASESDGTFMNVSSEATCHKKDIMGNEDSPFFKEAIKLKISLSDVKVKDKKNKKRVKVKRRIFPLTDKQQPDPSDGFYHMEQKGEMKIKLSRVPKTPVQKNGDLMSYWKVRKSGGCRLVFSAEKKVSHQENTQRDSRDTNQQVVKNRHSISTPEKRKAENVEEDEQSGKLRKRRKCIYLQFF